MDNHYSMTQEIKDIRSDKINVSPIKKKYEPKLVNSHWSPGF